MTTFEILRSAPLSSLTELQAFVHDLGALVHVLDRFAGFLLDALDQLGNFFGRLRRFFRQLSDFVGNDGESQSVFSGARRFNRGIQRQQVGLLGEIVDDLDDLADVVGPLPEHVR